MRELVEQYLRAAKEKDTEALDRIFTEDAVYIDVTGLTCCGLQQLRRRFEQLAGGGTIRAWDLRRVIDAGETGAAEWYFEYRTEDEDTVSYDGVSIIELCDGKIRRWSEFAQPTAKTWL